MEFSIHHVSRNAPRGTAFFEHPESWGERKEHYKKVASGEVNRDSISPDDPLPALEDIFMSENGLENPNVNILDAEEPRRSLSVGDVVVIDDTPYEVGSIGFRNITNRNETDSTGTDHLHDIGSLEEEV